MILPPLEALVASGDGQYGTVGEVLQIPLQVVVRNLATQLPRTGLTMVWSIEEGAASFETISMTATDSTGSASVRVRLGMQTGEVVIRAQAVDQDRATATFRLFTVERPVLNGLSMSSVVPGGEVVLSGSDFSPVPDQNVVLFSGVRGLVTGASSDELTVQVPTCLPERSVAVTVQLGTVTSSARPVDVEAGGEVATLEIGDFVDATDDGGFTCVTVPGDGSARYLAIVQSGSSIGAASYPFSLTGLSSEGPSPGAGMARIGASASTQGSARARGSVRPRASDGSLGSRDPQLSWDERLREMEIELAGASAAAGRSTDARGPVAVTGPTPAPQLGEERTFQVFRNPGDFVEVTAVARHIGERAALFVDQAAPSGGYRGVDLQLFSDRFDDAIHPAVTDAFGGVSDLDANDRIVILFTPAVNALTPRGSSGFIAGFFFGLDLLPEQDGSNAGEIFYSVVPDPDGTVSDRRTRSALLEVTPAILAHEFQHMVNFNERVLLRGAEAGEAVWLSEALAQYAEELVAAEYEQGGDAESAELFRGGVRDRARRYLEEPATVSLVVSAGQGSLEERGAGFLYLLYLAERYGVDLVTRLTRTTRTGVGNVEAEVPDAWANVLSDWWTATYLDGPGSEVGPFTYAGVDLRGFLADPFPLEPEEPGPGDFLRNGSLPSSAAAYYIVSPPTTGSTTFRLGGAEGGVSAPQGVMRMRIVRVQ